MSNITPVVRSVGTVGAGAANTNPGLPSGIALGDLLLCFIEHNAGETVTSTNWRARVLNSAAGSPGTGCTLLWRYATADASDTITLAGATDHTVACIVCIQGGTWQNAFANGNNNDTYGGINSIMGATVADDETASDSTVNWSGLTTVFDNTMVFLVAALEADRSVGGVSSPSLGTLLQRVDTNTGGVGNGGSLYVVTGIDTTAGSVSASSSTISGGAVVNKAMASFALRPKVEHTPELRRLAAAGTTGTGTVTPPLPVEAASDDLLVLVVIGSNTVAATATGYTQLDAQDYGTSRITVLYKIHSGSESAPTVSDTGSRTQAYIMSFRKNTFSTTAPFNATAKGSASIASTAIVALGVTTTVANCAVFQIVANEDDVIVSDLPVNAALSALHVSATASTADGNDGGFAIYGGLKLTAGATGTTSGNWASSTTEKGYLTFAIAPRDNISKTLAANAVGSVAQTSHDYEFEQRNLAADGKPSVSFAGTHLYETDLYNFAANGKPSISFAGTDLITQLGPFDFEADGKPVITFATQMKIARPPQFEPRLELDYWPVKPPRPALAGFGLVVNADLEFDYVRKVGTTAQRPTARPVGWPYFDTTLGALVVWTGSTWATV